MKRGTIEHPKLLRLCSLLNLKRFEAVGLLESIWHFTAKYAPQGDIGRFSDKDIAKAVEWERPTGTKGVTPECKLSAALVDAGWLDSDPTHRLVVHDWADHADQQVTRTLARRKLAFVQSKTSMPEPLPEPYPEPEPVNPLKPPAPKTGADSLGPRPVPSKKRKHRTTEEIRAALGERLPWWEGFWAVYPCHEGMNDAMDAFEKLVHERDLAVEIFRGAEAYAARARADPDIKLKYGQGWLNTERWRDENKIAPAVPKKQKTFMDDITQVFGERLYERKTGGQSGGETDGPQVLSK